MQVAVDFSHVPEHQADIDKRLANWARSLFGSSGSGTSPMFRLFKSADHHIAPRNSMPFDSHDALRIAKGVRELPINHRKAIQWFYVLTTSPKKACKNIGCTYLELYGYTNDARQMLINRKV